MNKIFIFAAALAASMLAGCATTDHKAASEQHYKAQKEFQAANPQKPVLSIEAMDGQTVQISGLKKLEVYAGASGQAAQFVPYVAEPSEAVQVTKAIIGGITTTVGAVMPVVGARVQALGAAGLVNAAGGIASGGFKSLTETAAVGFKASKEIAGQIQAPTPTITTTNNIAGSNGVNIGSGSAQTTDSHNTTVDNSQRNPIDNSQANPNNSVNSSNNPVNNSNQGNPITYPAAAP